MPNDPFDDLIREMDADILDSFGNTLTAIEPAGAAVEFLGIIDEEVATFTPDGAYQGTETHLSADQTVGLQAKWNISTGSKKYRIVRALEADGFMVRYLLAPISTYDFEVLEQVDQVLNEIVNNQW